MKTRSLTIRLKHVDAFTTSKFTGNSAGVVLDATGLSDEHMRLIAREKNVSETAFVLPPSVNDADVRIRWFTPSAEVPLCGHATIAAFHALAEEGLLGMRPEGQHYFRVETRSGILPVRVEKNFYEISVELHLPRPRLRAVKTVSDAVLGALDLRRADMERTLPPCTESYYYLPIRKISTIRRMRPDFKRLLEVSQRLKVLGFCVFTLQTLDKKSAVHSRFFAPRVGIPEDPVTGSANGPLGVYLYGFAKPLGFDVPSRTLSDGRIEYVGEQGDEIARPGRVKIRLQVSNGKVVSVSIAGEAVTVFDETLSL